MGTPWARVQEICGIRRGFFLPQDRPLNIWVTDDLEEFLNEHICDEGRGNYCGQARCVEWCTVHLRQDNPFHGIKEWSGTSFVETMLKKLGLRIQLGHKWVEICPGILVRMAAEQARTPTQEEQAKVESFCIVDNLAIHEFSAAGSYSKFLQMTREWRHLQMLKHSRNIGAGACTILCLACPQPGKNLPSDRERQHVAREKRHLYTLFLAIDANFRMKQVSSEEADPGLNKGVAIFSDMKAYMEHVGKNWEMEQDKSNCVSHDVVDQPDREARGTASSGIGTVDCARHNMKRPNGVGDLQKGERHINMDYMLWMSLAGYDELVQLIFHLPAHIEACNILYSFNLTPYVDQTDGKAPECGWANANSLASSTMQMRPGSCRDVLDNHFNDWNHKKVIALGCVILERIQKAVGQMVDKQQELVETGVSLPTETLVLWTKAMELWELDPQNPNPLNVAEKHASLQAVRGQIAEEMKNGVEGDAAGNVRGELPAVDMITMGLQLEGEQRDLASDVRALKWHAMDGQKTTMLERGNKLQRKIASWIQTQTSFQPSLATQCASDDQSRATAAKSQPIAGLAVHAIELWLPSKQARTSGFSIKPSHTKYKFDMQEANTYAMLENVRQLLLVRTHQCKLNKKHISGVAGGTQARATIQICRGLLAARRAMVSLAPSLKEVNWKLVLKELLPEDVRGMPNTLFHDPKQKKKKKQKTGEEPQEPPQPREMSWIWRMGMTSLTAAVSISEDAVWQATDEGLRVEGAKTWARAHRWTEEVDLLEDEMRRILVFVEWHTAWWRDLKSGQGDAREDMEDVGTDEGGHVDAELCEGLNAYAVGQAMIQDDMKT
ncbi:hypothetical protein C8R44DRAFT_745254 [Mycena epipterygia]|nr:hypothetical protein C8R44DRAFT_745254 [Mycena epipterygia]